MKNLIMGAATGYAWYALEPFVTSCKKNCPDADLVLFVDDISDFTRDKLIRGATLEQFPAELKSGIPNNTRWKIFADYLAAHDGDYAQIFTTDTRDVIFQGDVFAPFKAYTNWLGYATELKLIGEERKYNYPWLVDCFGKAEADKLVDKKIICSGTVIGSLDAMKIFCRTMWEILQHKTTDIFDQAAMNYLVWNNLLPIENLIEFDVHSGAILTVPYYQKIFSDKIRGDKILRGDGGVPAVVHQYDRSEELVELVDKVYRDKNFHADEKFSDMRSVIEQTTYLLHADKTVEATQIFLRKLLAYTDFSDYLQPLMKLWNLVLKKSPSKTSELLDAAIQDALTSVTCLPNELLRKILETILLAEKIGRSVNFKFKINIANALLLVANDAVNANQAERCFECLAQIDKLNMPPDKNFYLFVAKANRIFGRKEQALAAYKEALELN